MGFQRHRLGELSRHRLVAGFHSERHVPGIEAQTLDTETDQESIGLETTHPSWRPSSHL